MDNMKMKKRLPLIMLGIAILVVSVGISKYFLSSKKKPGRKPPASYVPSVEVIKINPSGTFINIPAMGKIEADEKVSLKCQVSGKITWTSPKLTDGGIFSRITSYNVCYTKLLRNRFLKNTGLLKKAMEYTDEMDTFEAIRKLSIRKPSIRLMQRYMRAIRNNFV